MSEKEIVIACRQVCVAFSEPGLSVEVLNLGIEAIAVLLVSEWLLGAGVPCLQLVRAVGGVAVNQ